MYLCKKKQTRHVVNSEDSPIALQLPQPWAKLTQQHLKWKAMLESFRFFCVQFLKVYTCQSVSFLQSLNVQKSFLECMAYPVQSVDHIDFCFILDWKIPGCWIPNTIVLFRVFMRHSFAKAIFDLLTSVLLPTCKAKK